MVGKKHSELMKDIRRYIGYLNEGKIPPVEFFIESTYQDSKNETRPNFLLTKQGHRKENNAHTNYEWARSPSVANQCWTNLS